MSHGEQSGAAHTLYYIPKALRKPNQQKWLRFTSHARILQSTLACIWLLEIVLIERRKSAKLRLFLGRAMPNIPAVLSTFHRVGKPL